MNIKLLSLATLVLASVFSVSALADQNTPAAGNAPAAQGGSGMPQQPQTIRNDAQNYREAMQGNTGTNPPDQTQWQKDKGKMKHWREGEKKRHEEMKQKREQHRMEHRQNRQNGQHGPAGAAPGTGGMVPAPGTGGMAPAPGTGGMAPAAGGTGAPANGTAAPNSPPSP